MSLTKNIYSKHLQVRHYLMKDLEADRSVVDSLHHLIQNRSKAKEKLSYLYKTKKFTVVDNEVKEKGEKQLKKDSLFGLVSMGKVAPETHTQLRELPWRNAVAEAPIYKHSI